MNAKVKGFDFLNKKAYNKQTDEIGIATNMERPFKELYINVKWLNHFALCNIMAVEYVLNEFNTGVFMAQPEFNILVKNFEAILANTQLKRNEDLELSFLDDLCRDIVQFYATLFTQEDKKRAQQILD